MSKTAKYNEAGHAVIFDNTTQERISVIASVVFYDDFIGSDVVIPAAGSPESGCRWVQKDVAGGVLGGVADQLNGAISCALDATSEKQEAGAYFNDELQFSILQSLVFEARINPTVLPTGAGEMVIGLISAWADGLDTATYSAFFTLDGSGEIFCESDDNATDASTTSGVTLTAGVEAVLRIECAAAGIKFYINGNLVKTSAAWAASAANSHVQPYFGVYKASGTGLGTLLADYVRMWQNRS